MSELSSRLSYQIISGLTVVISLVSICSSIYIIVSWRRLRKLKQNDILHDYVAYMSVFDLLGISLRAVYLSNPTFDLTFIADAPTVLCKILGGILQFADMCMVTWNFMIVAFILLPIILGQPMHKIIRLKYVHFIFITVMVFVWVLIPAINDGYGLTDNVATQYGLSKFDCWIEQSADYFCLFVPVSFYLIFSILTFIWTMLCKFKGDETLSELQLQLIWYTAVFIITWTPPMITRTYGYFTDNTSLVLTYLQTISYHSIGWANAVVWYNYMKPLTDAIETLPLVGNESEQTNERIQ
eukprot:239903_1